MKDIQDVVPKQLEYASTVPSGFVNLLSANMDTGQEGA
jgi:hypothetical protein